jgi:predicted small lipoprotein YifL
MLRQERSRSALVVAVICASVALAGCGIKGPLRPPPKTTTTPPPPPVDNPARPPAQTSPALPPPPSDQRL